MNQRAISDDLRAEVYELTAASLAEELSSDQAQRLCDLVCQDPEACRHYVRFMSDTLELSAIAGRVEPARSDETPGTLIATDANHVAPPIQPARRTSWLSQHIPRNSIIITAVLFLAVGIILERLYQPNDTDGGTRDTTEQTPAAKHVAILNHERDVTWIEGERTHAWDPRLWPGEKLVIAEGLIELKYLTGARVVIEGPAEFYVGAKDKGERKQGTAAERLAREEAGRGSLNSDNSGYLALGRLVARCDTPDSQGFTVETASGRIEDLGTEFSVGVDRGGDVRLHVFEGRVRLEGTTGSLAERNLVLAAGEGLAWDATGRVRSSSARPVRRYSALASRIRKDAAADIVTDLEPGLLLARFGAKAPRLIYPGHEPTITDAPAELIGLAAIISPRGDFTEAGAGYRFKIRERARLYLLVHNRGDHAPVGWQRTEGQVTWKTTQEYTGTDTVYTRIVEPGDIEIPAHVGRDDEQSRYGVPHVCLVATVDDAATGAPAKTDSSSANTIGVEDEPLKR